MFRLAVAVIVVQASSAFLLNGPSQRGDVRATADISSECQAMANVGNCSFFDCFEQRFQCGSHGYALAYGGKYCRRLEGAKDVFTDAGDVFIERMAQCQMSHLLPFYQQDHLNCQTFYDQSFVKMGECYLQSGYCDVVVDNFDGFMQTFDRNDFLNLKLVNQVLGAAEKCGGGVEAQLIRDFITSGLSG